MTTVRALNIGCGQWPIKKVGWVNIDEDSGSVADVKVRVPPLPYEDDSIEEIYAGHFLEHLHPQESHIFLKECYRTLVPGGKLGILVPDTHEIFRRYVEKSPTDTRIQVEDGTIRDLTDLDDLCAAIIYSTIQRSPHLWHYDHNTLTRLLVSNGFQVTGEMDKYKDPRVAMGAWYQFGLDSVKPSNI